jgi:hypothetical protein
MADTIKGIGKGLNNKLAKQIGEHLVCAELGKRNLIATPFAGNVPAFDIVAVDGHCRPVPIQVKASRSDSWRSDARLWMNISFNKETKAQSNLGPIAITNPDLIYVCVAIATTDASKDRFFILTKSQLQDACIKTYSAWMDTIKWKRPRKPECYDNRYYIDGIRGDGVGGLKTYEDNWKLISDRLATSNIGESPEQVSLLNGP